MQITIAPDGHVSSAVLVDSSMDDPVVEACISAELLRVEIAPREDELVIQYPFAFSSS
jgi:hypothetical protein